MDRLQFQGTCVDNPFNTVHVLCECIDRAREITKKTFFKRCEVEECVERDMAKFPNDYTFHKSGQRVYFYTWSAIEHFYIKVCR